MITNLDINITGICNFKCKYCFGENEKEGNMKKEIFSNYIKFAKELKIPNLEFCGGEPLLHPDFIEFTNISKNNKFSLILRTNGIFIEKYIDIISKKFDHIGISLDGLPVINSIHRESKIKISSEDQFLKPINAIYSIKEKNPRINIILATVVSNLDHKEIPVFAEYLINNKVPINKWKIYQFVSNYFRSLIYKDNLIISKETFDNLKKNHIFNKLNIIFVANDSFSKSCLIGRVNGDLVIDSKIIGNVNIDSLDELKQKIEKIDFSLLNNNKVSSYG